MTFKDMIDKNPMVTMEDAYNIIVYASIIQNGFAYPDRLANAVERIRGRLSYLADAYGESITTEYLDCNSEPARYFSPEHSNYSEKHSLVNIRELLKVYNADLKANGVPTILISKWYHSTSSAQPEIATSSRSIIDLVSAIAKITKDSVTRDEKLSAEIFESNFNDCTAKIQDQVIISMLPEIKVIIRDKIKTKMASGNISTITNKKIEATIILTEKYHDKAITLSSKQELVKSLKDCDLLKADKEHVVDTFITVKTR